MRIPYRHTKSTLDARKGLTEGVRPLPCVDLSVFRTVDVGAIRHGTAPHASAGSLRPQWPTQVSILSWNARQIAFSMWVTAVR